MRPCENTRTEFFLLLQMLLLYHVYEQLIFVSYTFLSDRILLLIRSVAWIGLGRQRIDLLLLVPINIELLVNPASLFLVFLFLRLCELFHFLSDLYLPLSLTSLGYLLFCQCALLYILIRFFIHSSHIRLRYFSSRNLRRLLWVINLYSHHV